MRFSVTKSGRLGARGGTPYAKIEEALRYAELLIVSKRSGETVRLEDKQTGERFDEAGIAEIRKLVSDA
jgi:hypothetical protein